MKERTPKQASKTCYHHSKGSKMSQLLGPDLIYKILEN